MSNLYCFGDETTYTDGGEPAVERAVASVRDRSAQSDELNGMATDWPTTYHLSRARANLLQPFCWRPGLRVLEIGAGCGALTRFLGETGAEIEAIEPAPARARIAALRTSDLSNVRVGVGRLAEFQTDSPFDVALLIGVLEYCERYGQTPEEFLAGVRHLVAPHGVLIVAIENQLGLKYQLGYVEDHIGRPFVGIEGYPDPQGIRTFSHGQLGTLVAGAGFAQQRWLYPFPDYKLPTTIVDASGLATPDNARAHLSLVRDLVSDSRSAPTLPFDPRRAMATWADAGLAAQVANSFLLVAGAGAEVVDFVEPDVSLWQFTSTRRLGAWGVRRSFSRGATSTGLAVVKSTSLNPGASRESGWLRQNVIDERPFVNGPTLFDDLLSAAERGDEDGVKAVCLALRDELERHALSDHRAPDAAMNADVQHPFTSWMPTSGPRIPGRFLDVAFDNFVRNEEGLHFIDVEWNAIGGVDLFAVLSRALRLVAERSATWRARPWPASWSGEQIFFRLLVLTGIPHDDQSLERSVLAEAELQSRVLGGTPADRRIEIEGAIAASPLAPISQDAVATTLRSWSEKTATDIAVRDGEIIRLGQVVGEATSQAQRAAADVAVRDREIRRIGGVLGEVIAQAQRTAATVAARDAEIRRLSQVVGDVTAQAQRAAAAVAERDEEIRRLGQVVGEVAAHAQRVAADVADRDGEIRRLGQVVGDVTAVRDQEIVRLNQVLVDVTAVRDQEIVRLNQVLTEVTTWAQRAAGDVAIRDEQLLRLSAELADSQARETALQDQTEAMSSRRSANADNTPHAVGVSSSPAI